MTPTHLLIGTIREGEGIAAGILESFGVTLDKLRRESQKIKRQESRMAKKPQGEEVLKRVDAFFKDSDIDQSTKDHLRSVLKALIDLASEKRSNSPQN